MKRERGATLTDDVADESRGNGPIVRTVVAGARAAAPDPGADGAGILPALRPGRDGEFASSVIDRAADGRPGAPARIIVDVPSSVVSESPETPEAEVANLRMVGTLLLLVRTIDERFRQLPGSGALSLTELNVLGQIERGSDTPTQLARRLRLDPARVTHLTDRLVGLGLVARAVDAQDRRRWRLSLTPAGAAQLAEGRADVQRAMGGITSALDERERAALAAGLTAARRALDGEAGSENH